MAIPGSTSEPVRAAGRPQRLRLGDILVAQKVISPEQLKLALDEQKRSGHRLGRVLIDLGVTAELNIAQALARQLNVGFFDLQHHNFKAQGALKLPASSGGRLRA